MLAIQNLSFAYNADSDDAIVALRDVSLQIQPGELVAVIGHNGSGKSTLAKLLCAMLTPTGGGFSVDGIPAAPDTVWEIRRRVGMVFQRPDDQLVANTVIDDVAFGPENLGLMRSEIEHRVRESLAALGMADRTHAQISELSGGEKQRVAIASVLAMRPNYLILDEPTTMVAPTIARQVIRLAHDVRERFQVAVVHITHFMHEVVSFDRIVVMDGGQVLMHGPPAEIFARSAELRAVGLNVPQVTRLAQRLRARGVDLPPAVLTADAFVAALSEMRRTTNDQRPTPALSAVEGTDDRRPTTEHGTTDNGRPTTNDGGLETESHAADRAVNAAEPPLLETRDLHFTYMAGTPLAETALRGTSCRIAEGETVALLGGTQAGKSTLIEFLNGLRRAGPGRVFYQGRDVAARDFPIETLRTDVGIVFQQPETQLLEEIVGLDVSFAPRRKGLPPAESRAIVEASLNAVGLDYEQFRLRYIYALSGGQKRRVALAGVLAAQPKVLILDEPVAGLDPRGRAELAALIGDLTRRRGLTVILVGNTIDELAELADRAIVLHDGQVAMEGPLRALLRRADALHGLGLELSEAAQLALALRAIWPDLPTDVLRIDELEILLADRLDLPEVVPDA